MPVNETLELQDQLREAVGLELDAIVVNGLYPGRINVQEARRLRELAERDGRDPGRIAAVRAAVAASDRAHAQRQHLRRLKRSARAPVHTLPYLFDEELGLTEYRELADRLARRLGDTGSG
jgi:hypothetical protein